MFGTELSIRKVLFIFLIQCTEPLLQSVQNDSFTYAPYLQSNVQEYNTRAVNEVRANVSLKKKNHPNTTHGRCPYDPTCGRPQVSLPILLGNTGFFLFFLYFFLKCSDWFGSKDQLMVLGWYKEGPKWWGLRSFGRAGGSPGSRMSVNKSSNSFRVDCIYEI